MYKIVLPKVKVWASKSPMLGVKLSLGRKFDFKYFVCFCGNANCDLFFLTNQGIESVRGQRSCQSHHDLYTFRGHFLYI